MQMTVLTSFCDKQSIRSSADGSDTHCVHRFRPCQPTITLCCRVAAISLFSLKKLFGGSISRKKYHTNLVFSLSSTQRRQHYSTLRAPLPLYRCHQGGHGSRTRHRTRLVRRVVACERETEVCEAGCNFLQVETGGCAPRTLSSSGVKAQMALDEETANLAKLHCELK
jgi:hypothetical protein